MAFCVANSGNAIYEPAYSFGSETETKNLVLLSKLMFINRKFSLQIQGGSNMTGTNCDLFTHK